MIDINHEIAIAFQATQLILVFVTLLFGLCYTQIKAVISKPKPYDSADTKKLIFDLEKNLGLNWMNILILAGSLWLFSPLLTQIALNSNFSLWNLDLTRSSFVFIYLLILIFLLWAIKLTIDLILRIKLMREK